MENLRLGTTIKSLFCILLFLICTVFSYAQEIKHDAFADTATAILDKVEAEKRFLEYLSANDLNSLPVGIKSNAGIGNNASVTIAIGKVDFLPAYAEITVFARMHIPEGDKKLEFGARGIRLSYKGGLIGDAKLSLLGDKNISMWGSVLTLKGSHFLTNDPDLTYISIDCNGFKELSLVAEIELPKIFHPVNSTNTENSDKVIAHFNTTVRSWNDILAEITLPTFSLKGLPDFIFKVQKAVIDLSDIRNSAVAQFPSSYRSGKYAGADSPLWRGLYIENLEINLPRYIIKKNSQERVSLSGKNMLIDANGVSGSFFADKILGFEEGTASGWNLSIQNFRLELEANRLIGAGFEGQLGIPIGDQQNLEYKAFFSANNEYLLQVTPPDNLEFNLWSAKAQIDKSSYAELKVIDGKFKPSIMLNGYMSIAASNHSASGTVPTNPDDQVCVVPKVVFQQMHISTEAPYFLVDYLGYQESSFMKGFPIRIKDISLKSTVKTTDSRESNIALKFRVDLDLSESLIQGSTELQINAALEKRNDGFKIRYKGVQVSRIFIKANIAEALSIKGSIDLYDSDPIYGNGFGGAIEMDVNVLKLTKISARVKFGKTDFRYWYVDAMAEFGQVGIPIPPALSIRGISGAAYNRVLKSPSKNNINPSGMDYIPHAEAGFGIRLGILMHVSKKEICDIEGSFEVSFNRHGGINYIGIFGSASLLGKIPGISDAEEFLKAKVAAVNDKLKNIGITDLKSLGVLNQMATSDPSAAAELFQAGPNSQTPGSTGIKAHLGILFDFQNKAFQASFEVYINFIGGILQGIGPQGRAGYAIARFAPDEWYICAGTPDDPIGVQLNIGILKVNTRSYIMIGNKIPGSPAPPRQVADILGTSVQALDYMRDLNALGTGAGFAFGSHLSVSTGDFRFLILYANLEAGLGFDIMLKNYGINAHCEGKSGPIGINGWYANGQAYAYLQGEVGIQVRLFMKTRRFTILKAGAAAIFQAKLPNPSWFKGRLGIRYKVLGGLIKGRINLTITLGKECKIVGAALDEEMPIISDLSPKNNDKEVDVFMAPQAAFNIPIGQEMTIEEDGQTQTFRIKLEDFSLTAAGSPITGTLQWNTDMNLVSFYSKEILPPNSSVTVTVRVSMEEKKQGQWQAAYENGAKVEEIKSVNFQTGDAPYYIPLQNIAYMYPVKDQQNYYIDESRTGWIQLKRGQRYLFTQPDAIALTFENNSTLSSVPVAYDIENLRLGFTMPKQSKSSSYTVQLLNKNPDPTQLTSENRSFQKRTDEEGNEMEVAHTQAQGQQRSDLHQVYLDYEYNSSSYSSFAKKLDAIKHKQPLFWILSEDVIDLQIKTSEYEAFDQLELLGSPYTGDQPLVQVEADLKGEKYYEDYIYPLLYAGYPLDSNVTISHRDISELGLIPIKGMRVANSVLADLDAGKVSGYHTGYLPWIYNLPFHYKMDFLDLQNKAVNRYLGTATATRFKHLIQGTYPFILKGKYKTIYQYRLPGGSIGTSQNIRYESKINTTKSN